MGHDLKEEDRGHDFAERLFALVFEHGPAGMSRAEQDALAGYLLSNAIAWVQAKNRNGAALASQDQGGSDA